MFSQVPTPRVDHRDEELLLDREVIEKRENHWPSLVIFPLPEAVDIQESIRGHRNAGNVDEKVQGKSSIVQAELVRYVFMNAFQSPLWNETRIPL